jgi:hypothetical protein
MKKIKSIIRVLFFASVTLSSCGINSEESKVEESEIFKIGSTYAFFIQGCNFECAECDESWKLKFLDKENAELWSHSSSSNFPSCKSEVKYSYQNETISIVSINNSNVSSQCISSIIGDYKYNSSKKLFVSLKNPNCNLNWYE